MSYNIPNNGDGGKLKSFPLFRAFVNHGQLHQLNIIINEKEYWNQKTLRIHNIPIDQLALNRNRKGKEFDPKDVWFRLIVHGRLNGQHVIQGEEIPGE